MLKGRKNVGYLHFLLLHQAQLTDKLLQVMLLIITGIIFIYKFVLERSSVVSCINFVELFVSRLFACSMILCGFFQAKRCVLVLNVGVFTLIVYPAPYFVVFIAFICDVVRFS